jgi:hypothetical protein
MRFQANQPFTPAADAADSIGPSGRTSLRRHTGLARSGEGNDMSTRRFILVIVIVTFAVAVFGPILRGFGTVPDRAADDKAVQPPNADAMAKLMRKKLEHAQKLLEGIAINDLKKVDENAADLMTLSKLAEFRALQTPAYDRHTNDFRRTLDDMRRGAKNKNLEAVTLAYMDMTMTCVRCHTHVRDTRLARLD